MKACAEDCLGSVLLALCFFVIGCTFGAKTTMHQAVKYGGAEYNSKSGYFKWIDHNEHSTVPKTASEN